ncbi:hypothetical protein EDC04DRAFT_2912304 [Pisolithus marmoratus]|nr:hypothetical protein EDC04DRAFT_2912304 [Pisolithus marmoratus]
MDVLLLVARTLLLIFAALNFRSTTWRLISCSVVVALLAADMPLIHTGDMVFDHLLGTILGVTILRSVRILLLVRPLEEYRHESDRVPAYRLPFIQRFLWLFKMACSPRGIGWSFMAENSVVPVDLCHRTRASFITSRLRWFFSHYLLLEAATLYTNYNPVFLSEASVTSQGFIMQCLNVVAFPCQAYAILTCIHCALAVVAVGANLSEPQAWPQPFGHWKNAYTIRKSWGKVWHQMFRHDLTLFGPHRPKCNNPWDLVRSEHPSASKPREREPWATAYRRLCYAFICSAFVHVCGDIVLQFRVWSKISSTGASGTMDTPNLIGYSAPYFFLQPVGVLVEDAVMEVGKRMGLREGAWTRMVGYVWVWMFTGLSSAFTLDGLIAAFRIGQRAGEGIGAKATLIEIIADRLFGVQLAPVISSWLSHV